MFLPIDALHEAVHALDLDVGPKHRFRDAQGSRARFHLLQQDGVATADSKGGTGLFGDLEMAIIAEEYARRRGKTFAPKKTAATGTARPSWGSGYRGMG